MELRPLLITRIANVVGSLLIAAAGVGLWLDDGVEAALLLTGVGIWLALRAYWIGVDANDHTVKLRGLLWSRTIEIGRIRRITHVPAVSWTSPGGRPRWSPVFAFADAGGVMRLVAEHNERCTERLEGWIAARR